MIIPKSKVNLIEEALQAYLKIKYSLSDEDLQKILRMIDKCNLVIQGDATGLQFSQVYGNINSKAHPPNLVVDGKPWSFNDLQSTISYYMYEKYGRNVDKSDIKYEW
jgi:hypothetical protein